MYYNIKLSTAFLLLIILSSCVKTEDPCHGVKHLKADFYMEEVCSSNVCPDFWQDYKTAYCSNGLIRFTSTNDSILSFEWHIGSGIYHGYKFELSGFVPDGAIIPVMLIVKQTPNPMCIPNDNGVDTIIKNLKIDYKTHLCYGRWKGIYTDTPNDTSIILIAKDYNPAAFDSIAYIKYLYPSVSDTLMGYVSRRQDFRQEISVGLGSNNISSYGKALTDSLGFNIVIDYTYMSLPNTTQFRKTFKGIRI